MTRSKLIRLIAYLGICSLIIAIVDRLGEGETQQDGYPGKAITIIVPFKPGGGSDRIARTVNRFTESEFGRPFIFQYKTGGGGHLGIGFLAQSRADGYTIATYNTPDLALGPLTDAGQYELNDLRIIGQIAFDPNVFATQSDSRFENMKAFLDEAKQSPGKLRLGIAQPKGGTHLSTLAMLDQEGVDVSVVLFAGGSELATAVLGGQVDAGVSGLAPFLGSLERVKFLATAGSSRHPKLPDTSTMIEQGIVMDSGNGRVFLAPSEIEPERLERLRSGFKSIYENPGFVSEMNAIGNAPSWKDGAQVETELKSFSERAIAMIEKYDL